MPSMIMLTNCTSRKRQSPAVDLCGRSIAAGSIQEIAANWLSRLPKRGTITPADLYSGRSFHIARKAANVAHADLHVLSAGFGLVSIDQRVSPYNLTVSGDTPDNVVARSTDGTPRKWWQSIRDPLNRLDCLKASTCVLAALSEHYLDMIADDLAELAKTQDGKLILFVADSNRKRLPALLQHLVMPYHAALDAPQSPFRGTGSDAVQRQMLHFASAILPTLPKRWTVENARHQVAFFVDQRSSQTRRQGSPATDEEVKAHIQEARSLGITSWTSALRFLRHEKQLACAQVRFISLFNSIADGSASLDVHGER